VRVILQFGVPTCSAGGLQIDVPRLASCSRLDGWRSSVRAVGKGPLVSGYYQALIRTLMDNVENAEDRRVTSRDGESLPMACQIPESRPPSLCSKPTTSTHFIFYSGYPEVSPTRKPERSPKHSRD